MWRSEILERTGVMSIHGDEDELKYLRKVVKTMGRKINTQDAEISRLKLENERLREDMTGKYDVDYRVKTLTKENELLRRKVYVMIKATKTQQIKIDKLQNKVTQRYDLYS